MANDYFQFAWEYCDVFQRLKSEMGGRSVNLRDLRKKVVKKFVPSIKMDFIFSDLSLSQEDRESNPVYIYGAEEFPKKKYPADKFDLVCQTTRVSVIEMECFFTLKLSVFHIKIARFSHQV